MRSMMTSQQASASPLRILIMLAYSRLLDSHTGTCAEGITEENHIELLERWIERAHYNDARDMYVC